VPGGIEDAAHVGHARYKTEVFHVLLLGDPWKFQG
jgi:hypothetical protein